MKDTSIFAPKNLLDKKNTTNIQTNTIIKESFNKYNDIADIYSEERHNIENVDNIIQSILWIGIIYLIIKIVYNLVFDRTGFFY